jgi:hypothetical protein
LTWPQVGEFEVAATAHSATSDFDHDLGYPMDGAADLIDLGGGKGIGGDRATKAEQVATGACPLAGVRETV